MENISMQYPTNTNFMKNEAKKNQTNQIFTKNLDYY